MFMLPLSNCWGGMSAEWKPFACHVSSELHWQLSWAKAHRVGRANKGVRMTTWLSLCVCPAVWATLTLLFTAIYNCDVWGLLIRFWELLYPAASSRQTLPCLVCRLKHSFMNLGIHCYTGLKSPVDVLPLRGGLGRASWMFRTRG